MALSLIDAVVIEVQGDDMPARRELILAGDGVALDPSQVGPMPIPSATGV
jgi:hypothetical protein